MDITEELLPIGPDEWDLTLSRHSVRFGGRDVDALRRKYNKLHRKRSPTGDPHIPWEVEQAKRIKYMIGERACLGGGEEDYDV